MTIPRTIRWLVGPALLTGIALASASGLSAQAIGGRLLDGTDSHPIVLGVVMLLDETGDTVSAAVTNEQGIFTLTSPIPGIFRLRASALGYKETEAAEGFELGEGGSMTVDFRIAPAPIPLEELVVTLGKPVFDHQLVRNGFVRRYQRGLGVFITPHDIEESVARETPGLFRGINGVYVHPISGPASYIGDGVWMRSTSLSSRGWQCTPKVYVDGRDVRYDLNAGISLTMLVPLETIEAVEVYRRPAEIPVEYDAMRRSGTGSGGGRNEELCGVILFWTKQG